MNEQLYIEAKQEIAMKQNGIRPDVQALMCQATLLSLQANGQSIQSIQLVEQGEIEKELWSCDLESPKNMIYKILGAKFLEEKLSKYEDPLQYIRLRLAEEAIKTAAKEVGHNLLFSPCIGTVLSLDCNAVTLRVPGLERPLILFSLGILDFYESLVRCCVHLLKWNLNANDISYEIDTDYALNKLKNDAKITRSFQEALNNVFIAQMTSVVNEHLQPEVHMLGVDSALRGVIWHFIMGHEYGHLIHGDLNEEEADWMQEYKADARGFELMCNSTWQSVAPNSMQKEEVPIDFYHKIIGLSVFFSGIGIIEKASEFIFGDKGQQEKSTHPPAVERWQYLAAAIYKGSEDKELSLKTFKYANDMSNILWMLLSHSGEALRELRNKLSMSE
ncbi:MAG: hypothetical protein HOP19_13425 [Acidobacteria bacterium]|nr:hypothetical protein [Acidobacteriota bacterium]